MFLGVGYGLSRVVRRHRPRLQRLYAGSQGRLRSTRSRALCLYGLRLLNPARSHLKTNTTLQILSSGLVPNFEL